MTREDTRRWLAQFQADFGRTLRMPLDRSEGKLRAAQEQFPASLVNTLSDGPRSDARARMAVYNRQYWFRLLGVLQNEYPLTARLLGMWHFNGYAARFLEAQPPRHYDVQRVACGFAQFLELGLQEEPPAQRAVLLEAVRMDSAFREVLGAPPGPRFALNAAEARALPRAQLIASPSFRVVSESCALFMLRKRLEDDVSDHAVQHPQAHAEPQHWLLHALPTSLGAEPIHALHAALLIELGRRSVEDALAHVERSASPTQRAFLVQNAQRWLAESVQHGFWSGVRFET